jgi:hypothetical protein
MLVHPLMSHLARVAGLLLAAAGGAGVARLARRLRQALAAGRQRLPGRFRPQHFLTRKQA